MTEKKNRKKRMIMEEKESRKVKEKNGGIRRR